MSENDMFELTTPQKSIWMMEQFYKGTNINNICATLTINMDVDIERLNEAINIFIQNNESFGLDFCVQDEKLKQSFNEIEQINFECIKVKNQSEVQNLAKEMTKETFNINEDRLFKFKLYKLENNYGGFIVMTHHLISDAATMSIIGKEVIDIYSKLIHKEEIEKKEYSYKQYILDEKEYFSSPKFAKDRQYWLENFNTVPEIATIPVTSKNLHASFAGEAKREEFILNSNLLAKISQFCNQNKISNYNFFMAIYAIYLGRVSRLKDFVIGTPILNRTNFKEKHTTGMFINTAPLRIQIEENTDFISFAKSIAQSSMAMLRYQKYSYQLLLEELREKNTNLLTLYDVMLSYQVTKANNKESKIPYDVEWIPTNTISNGMYIHLHDNDDNGVLKIDYDYQVEKYTKKDIENLHSRILHIINQVLENTNCMEKDIEIVTLEEKDKILNKFNESYMNYEDKKSIVDLFEGQVKKVENNVAVVYKNEKLTYRQLNEKANSLANYLIKQGVKKGDTIPILLERNIDLIISMLAVIKAGAIYVPVFTGFPKDRVNYIIEDSKAKIVITSKENKYKDIKNVNINTFEYANYNGENIQINVQPQDTLYIIYTSGSTGKPKGVKISHNNLNNFVSAFTKYFNGVNSKDKCLASTNISFDVSIFEIFITLLNGAQLYLYEENSITDIFKYCDEIIKNGITLLYIPPNILENVYTILSNEKQIGINKLLIGVEPIRSSIIKKYYELNSNMRIINAYGPTETTICATANILEPSTIDKYTIIPIGKPIANSKILILDENLQLVPVGIKGEIYVLGNGVGQGYLNNAEKNEQSFIKISKYLDEKKAYRTRDLAKWNEDGTISFIGREDNQIKVSGHRIELGEIENCIYQYPNIDKVIVILDENKKTIAYYTSKENINIEKLKQFIGKTLPQYFIPNYFMQIEKFELTPNGKINKKLLPKVQIKERQIIQPQNKIQERLKNIWEGMLNQQNISIEDNLFEIGGDSLIAINLLTKIYSEFNVQMSIKEIFSNPTIIGMEKVIRKCEGKQAKSNIEKAPKKDRYKLSSAQKRIYYASTIDEKESILYNVSGGIVLNKKPNVELLEKCINTLIKKHSILRTQFELDNGELLQKIYNEQIFKLNIKKAYSNNLDEIFEQFVKPFQLLNSKLYRFELVELEDGRTFFMLDMHHSICDGTSLGIIMKELCDLYNGENADSEVIEYKDFAEWERENLQKEKFKKSEEYWKLQFKDEILNLNLPTTYKRQNQNSFLGDSEYNQIEYELCKNISEVANKLNCTTYMIYLAAYYILLSRYADQKDLVVGVPVVGRYLPELENVVGMFVNTLPIRSKIDTSDTFEQYIKKIKEICIGAIDNQEYPVEMINDTIDIQREDGKRRLFDTMFIFQNNGYPEIKLNGINAEYYIPKQKVSKVDISMEIIPNSNKTVDLRVEYCTELFDKEYARNFSKHYLQILNQICKNSAIQISKIDILTEEEKKMLKEFNSTEEVYSKEKSVIEIFEENAKKNPEDVAVIYKNNKITYRELNDRANNLAKSLIDNKVLPKNVVGILLTRSENIIVSMLAVLKTGCAYMLIDPNLPNERINYMLNDSKAIALITEENVKYIKFKNRIFLENVNNTQNENINIPKSIDDPFSIIYTSGSTGKPKGVLLHNKGVINVVLSHQKILNTDICNNFLSMSTVSFDMFMVETMVPLLSGKTVVLTTDEEQKIPLYTSKLMVKNNVDFILTTPSRIELFLSNKLYECLEKLKIIQLGGEVFTLELKDRLQECTKANLYNGYGPTEITACCAMKKVEDYVSLGKPLCNTQIYILNEENNMCPINIPGEICITGDGVSLGYINNEELTKKTFIENPFGSGYMYKTGDIGRINSSGELKYIDRKDSQIKIRGLRVELSEIEKQILNAINLNACTVIYKKDKGYISAFISSDERIDIAEARKKLAEKLPLYMIPKYITQLDEIPLTRNGKVNKKLLETYEEDNSEIVTYTEPKTEKEKLFCEIWEKLLNKKIGIDNDVFEYGADSLIAIKFKTELLAHDIEVPYADLFKYKTVRSFCKNSMIKDAEDEEQYDYTSINKRLEKNDIKNIEKIIYKNDNNLLLFGATGFVGMHIIESFIRNDNGKIYCIVRDKNNKSAYERFIELLHFYFGNKLDHYIGNRIIVIKGNVLKENFELSNKNYKNLKDNVDIVINSAAIVKHYGDEKKFIETNVGSTQNIVNFCMEKNKRLLHISSLSVSGNSSLEGDSQGITINEKMSFNEKDLYKGQNLNNSYLKSKFKAERLILEKMDERLDAQILRLGNITNRLSDGVFQINPEENAFACKIRSMIGLGAIPEYLKKEYMEFTPVDMCADAIIKIMQNYEENFSIFHIYDNEHVYFEKLRDYLENVDVNLEIVSHEKFRGKVEELLKGKNENILSGIINDFDKDKKLTYNSNIDILSEFTRAFLYKIGFVWPKIDEKYIEKYVKYMKKIKFL